MELKQLLKKNKKSFLIYILGAILTTPANVLVTYAFSTVFYIFDANTQSEYIKIVILTCVFAYLPIILQVISRYMRIGFMKDILLDVRVMSYEKLMKTRVNDFYKKSLDSYQASLVADINLFEKEFFISLLNIIYSAGSYIISITVMLFISYEIALLTILSSLMVFVVSKIFEKPIMKSKEKVLKENVIYQKVVSNILSGLQTIKLYQASNRFLKIFYIDVNKYEDIKANDYAINEVSTNVVYFVSFLMQCISYFVSAMLFAQGKVNISSLIIVLNLSGTLSWTVSQGMALINKLKSSILIYNELVKYEDKTIESKIFTFNKNVNLTNINLSYNDNSVLKDINLDIKPNEKILISGESGSGKTSLLNILVKNIEDYSGSATYDYVNLKDITYEGLMEKVSYVRQEHFLFDASIKENIILNKKYDEEKFLATLKASSLMDFVNNQKLKSNHLLVDNGSNISGGERQRINIARELYQNKPVIIFDEPSASLDDYNSSVIYESILNLKKTVIIVSHRHLEYFSEKVDKAFILSGGKLNE